MVAAVMGYPAYPASFDESVTFEGDRAVKYQLPGNAPFGSSLDGPTPPPHTAGC
jgi:hypothetical protein